MGIWIGLGFIALVALCGLAAAILGGIFSSEYKARFVGIGSLVFVVFALIGGLWLLTSSIVTVDARNVGIVLLYGKPQPGHLSNGRHLVNPAASVIEWDEAIQTSAFLNTRDSEGHLQENCLPVRIAGQQNACAPISIQWRIKPDAVDALYQSWRTFGGMETGLVTREMEQATTQQLSAYSPIAELQNGKVAGSQLVGIAKQIGDQMRAEIGGQIEVTKVLLLPLVYDSQTAHRLQSLQQQVVNTAIATQKVKTNVQLALANQKLSASVSHDPNVITAQCFQIVDEMVSKGMNPAGINCWAGGGGGNTVVIPGR